jgi:hypothetical protein
MKKGAALCRSFLSFELPVDGDVLCGLGRSVAVALGVAEFLRRVFELAGLDFVGADFLGGHFEAVFLLDERHVRKMADGSFEADVATLKFKVDAMERAVFFTKIGTAVTGVPAVAQVMFFVDVDDLEAQRIVLGRAPAKSKEGEEKKQSYGFHAGNLSPASINTEKLISDVVEIEHNAAGDKAVNAEEIPLAAFEP